MCPSQAPRGKAIAAAMPSATAETTMCSQVRVMIPISGTPVTSLTEFVQLSQVVNHSNTSANVSITAPPSDDSTA